MRWIFEALFNDLGTSPSFGDAMGEQGEVCLAHVGPERAMHDGGIDGGRRGAQRIVVLNSSRSVRRSHRDHVFIDNGSFTLRGHRSRTV